MIRTSYDLANTHPARIANGEQPSKRADGIHDFLLVLSQVYSVHPNLWQDPSPRYALEAELPIPHQNSLQSVHIS